MENNKVSKFIFGAVAIGVAVGGLVYAVKRYKKNVMMSLKVIQVDTKSK